MIEELRWRQVGPHRGGRVVAVAGHPQQKSTFFFGGCDGGIWKTEDAGVTWQNISDGQLRSASVGALAIAPSDPNVIYAGMGEACIRGNVSHGDGVYKSTDGGKSWRHMGLADTRHIGRVRVHPQNPDIVYVAALGHAYGPNAERGVFRSLDGGESFERVLYRSEDAGAIDLAMDPTNPRILYAAIWDVRRKPWTLISGGPGSGLFKSVDGGDSWQEITDRPGLPPGLKGRIGVTVSPVRPQRVWVVIEAEKGGLFRSDDGGETFERLTDNPDLRQRPWYYMHIFADPKDQDTVYVLNLRVWKSTDGGEAFTQIPTPHGDNHDLWIDPEDPRRMIEGNDGGACVSFTGGDSWSSVYNQPTAQFYHVITDTRFPYRIYGAQQDNTTLSVPSRSDRGAIMQAECYPVGGGESGYIAVRDDDPDIAFAGSYASRMTRYNHRTRQQRDITVWPEDPIGYGAGDLKYRFQWTFPILLSPHDPNVLYTTGNHVFRSRDEGHSFEVLSPDLTKGDPETLLSSGGPITKDNVSTEYYGTIFAFAESYVERGVLWAGSDDGLVHVSRDDGASWQDVTPPDLPEWALISMIEPSRHRRGVAYVIATRYKLDDLMPYVYKTTDYGQSWTLITAGIAEHDFTRCLREDPEREGLLFCGTESGLYVSYDDGGQWARVQGNLPIVPIHDLAIRHGDLIAATHGRAFWALDDITPFRQRTAETATAPAHLFAPPPAYRFPSAFTAPEGQPLGSKVYQRSAGDEIVGVVQAGSEGQREVFWLTAGMNPPTGALITYTFTKVPDGEVALVFRDAQGTEIRRFTNRTKEASNRKPMLPVKVGVNRFVWDLHYPSATSLGEGMLSAYWGGSTIGPKAAPGAYSVELHIDGKVLRQPLEVRRDPRAEASDEDLKAQFELLLAICDKLTEVHETVLDIRAVRKSVSDWAERATKADKAALAESAQSLMETLTRLENDLVEARSTSRADSFNYPPKVNSKLASLQSTVAYADDRPAQQCYDVFDVLSARADAVLKEWKEVRKTAVPSFNAELDASELPRVAGR